MSIRTTLCAVVTAVAVLAALLIAWLGSQDIREHVVREAQARVDRDLDVLLADHGRRLEAYASQLLRRVDEAAASGGTPAALLARVRSADFPLLTVCDAAGRRLAGTRADSAGPAPLAADPVLRRAANGRPAFGLVRLDPDRLRAEGGEAVAAAARVAAAGEAGGTAAALAWWVAVPLRDPDGRVTGLVYGGRPLNHDHELVDALRGLAFGDERYEGRPLGTVTIFLDDVRIATNVLAPGGRRAVGTLVSDAVRRHVLETGRRWSDRARVLDDWYLSGYAPLRDPDDTLVGMLYVGLLELPYADLQRERLWQFVGTVGLISVVAILIAFELVRRLTKPLRQLERAARALAAGDYDHALGVRGTFTEFAGLAATFESMRGAIVDRDRELSRQNAELRETGAALERANANYMTMLGFVTHELKAPLGAIQMMSEVLADRFADRLPDEGRHHLERIRVRCVELQDLVRDYLALSRAERGELVANPRGIDLRRDVVDPAVAQAEALFDARGMRVEIAAPDRVPCDGDPQLLRVALANLLSNAAKYGRDDGTTRVEVEVAADSVRIAVQDDGEGFAAADADALFGRFVRLDNAATRARHGSGLGLYLVRAIAEQHGGTAIARAEPGRFARFEIALPIRCAVREGLPDRPRAGPDETGSR